MTSDDLFCCHKPAACLPAASNYGERLHLTDSDSAVADQLQRLSPLVIGGGDVMCGVVVVEVNWMDLMDRIVCQAVFAVQNTLTFITLTLWSADRRLSVCLYLHIKEKV